MQKPALAHTIGSMTHHLQTTTLERAGERYRQAAGTPTFQPQAREVAA
jgi:hypothetical protein